MDCINVATLIGSLALLPVAKENCEHTDFLFYFRIGLCMMFLTLLRMFLTCVHFKQRARPFYKWLRRKFPSLSVIQYEERVVLEVWKLHEFIKLI